MEKRMKTRSRLSVITPFRLMSASLVALALGAGARLAYAEAFGIEQVPAFKINASSGGVSVDVPIPAGVLAHWIDGRGNRITKQTAEYKAVPAGGAVGLLKGRKCNWKFDFSYKANGKEYARERGKTINECSGILTPLRGFAKAKTVRYGQACAELWANGKFVAAQCHNITR
jgi:hypothetical protein